MATYDRLPVYKECYDLLLLLFQFCGMMQREYRYTLGEALKKELIALITDIFRANCSYRKKELLAGAREHVEVTRLLIRLCHDLKQLPLKTYALASDRIENISKQLTAWERSCKDQ
ncbi:MAG: four helix bundle protein [Prevotella sp.]|nr:four helix bundle protein [Prevotella sp.]